MRALRDEGPPELIDAFNAYESMMDEVMTLTPNDPANFDRLNQIMANPKYRDATTKLFTYAKQTCGFDLTDQGSSTTSTRTPTPATR